MKSIEINLIKPNGQPSIIFGKPAQELMDQAGLLVAEDRIPSMELKHISIDVKAMKLTIFMEERHARGTRGTTNF